jgi:hypothetical protein
MKVIIAVTSFPIFTINVLKRKMLLHSDIADICSIFCTQNQSKALKRSVTKLPTTFSHSSPITEASNFNFLAAAYRKYQNSYFLPKRQKPSSP